jgi:hypothetical protein
VLRALTQRKRVREILARREPFTRTSKKASAEKRSPIRQLANNLLRAAHEQGVSKEN